MTAYILIFFSFTIFWLFLFQKLLGNRSRSLWIVFISGVFIGPLSGYCSLLLQQNILPETSVLKSFHLEDLLLYFIVVGPIEEISKFFAVLPVALRTPIIKKSTDGMLLGIVAALGFAGGENVLYLLNYGPGSTWPRILLGNLGHAGYSVFWGYALGVVFAENASRSVLITGLVLASLLHGAYNYFLTFSMIGFIVAILFSAILFSFMFYFIHHETKRHK